MSERPYVESKLRIYKAFTDHVETVDMTQQDQPETTTTISITQHQESGITEITIVLDIVFGSHPSIKPYPHIFPTEVHALWIKLKWGYSIKRTTNEAKYNTF